MPAPGVRPLKPGVAEAIGRGEGPQQLSFSDLMGIDDFPEVKAAQRRRIQASAPSATEMSPELHQTLSFVLKGISEEIGISRCGVYLYDREGGQLTSYVELKDGGLTAPKGAVMSTHARGAGTALVARLAQGASGLTDETRQHVRLAHTAGENPQDLAGQNFLLHVSDAKTNPLTRGGYTEADNCAWIPLYGENREFVGVIWADNMGRDGVDRPITEQQQASLMLAGQYAGALIQNVQLRVKETASLLASAVHSHGLDRQATLDAICDTVLDYTGADKVDIRTRPRTALWDVDIHARGFPEDEEAALKHYLMQSRLKGVPHRMIQDMMQRGMAPEVIDVDAELAGGSSRLNPDLMGKLNMLGGTMIQMPISAGEDSIVSMRIYFGKDTTPGQFSMPALQIFLNNIASAVENTRIHQEALESRDRAFELMQGVGHNIRNPLATIGGFSISFLRSHPDSKEPAIIRDEVARLETALKRFDIIARFLSGNPPKYGLGVVDVGGVLQDVAGKFTPAAEKAGRPLEVSVQEGLPPANSNAEALGVILTELVENALVHTKEGPVRLSASEEEGRTRIRVSVSDEGGGMPGRIVGRPFEPFKDIFASTDPRRIGGGLFIAKSVTDLIGGEIRLEPAPGGGTTVEVMIPKAGQ